MEQVRIRRIAAAGLLWALGGCSDDPAVEPKDPPLTAEGCVAGSLAGLDPAGVWHLDRAIETRPISPQAIRIEADPLSATAFGIATTDVSLTDDLLRIRVETDQHPVLATATLEACARDTSGALLGSFRICLVDGRCTDGTFTAVRVERIPGEPEASNLELIGEWAGAGWQQGTTVNVRVQDGIAHLARYEDGLRMVDVSDPANPRDLGGSPTESPLELEAYNDVKLMTGRDGKRWALMASDVHAVVPIDVTDPSQPVRGPSIPPEGGNVHTLFLEPHGDRMLAYLAHIDSLGLQVWDVTDPLAPSLVTDFVHPDVDPERDGFVHDLYVEGRTAYLNYWELGLVVVDTSTTGGREPEILGVFDDYPRRTSHSSWVTTTSGGRKIAVHGDEDFGAHVRIVDVDPASSRFMEQIGEWALPPQVSVHNVMAFGDLAFVAHYQFGVRILDLSDPTAPRQVAHFNTWSPEAGGYSMYEGATGLDIDLQDRLIYVADIERGLLVLRHDIQ